LCPAWGILRRALSFQETKVDRKHIGAHHELIAIIWLLKQGFEVFRNVSQHGIIDIIAIKGNETLRLDVKGAGYRTDGSQEQKALSSEQINSGVKCLRVFPDGQCSIDFDPPLKGAVVTTSTCLECSKPIVHSPSHPQKFCSKTQCRNQYHFKLRQRGPDLKVAAVKE
jgi:hypothetical protein